MKKRIILGMMLASTFALASCDLLNESSDDTTPKKTETETTKPSKTEDKTITPSETKKEMKYEVGTATIDSWTNSSNSTWVKITVPVKNTGDVDIYLGDMSADIESSTGSLLKTKSMINAYPDYIKPGETAYYYGETRADFETTGIKVVPHVDIHKSSNDVIRYDINDVSINEDSLYGVKVMGRVENKTSKNGTLVYIAANLFDSNDKLITNCYTILDKDLNAGDKIGFTCTPFAYLECKPSDVARYEIYAYPTQFNIDLGY
jgi:hypothetical protein